jgi:hypothetical protein
MMMIDDISAARWFSILSVHIARWRSIRFALWHYVFIFRLTSVNNSVRSMAFYSFCSMAINLFCSMAFARWRSIHFSRWLSFCSMAFARWRSIRFALWLSLDGVQFVLLDGFRFALWLLLDGVQFVFYFVQFILFNLLLVVSFALS